MIDRNKREGRTVGFVPTMGFLHEGHLTLVKQAREHNDIVVMSIFVNPAQFGPGEDFEAYPRDAKRDASLAQEAGVDILVHADAGRNVSARRWYPHFARASAKVLCGASRPGHFDGVLKVVLKLFNIVDPDSSYFGMKDAQQLAIIETFVRDYNLRTSIVRVPIVREQDGLRKVLGMSILPRWNVRRRQLSSKHLKRVHCCLMKVSLSNEIEQEITAYITENSSGHNGLYFATVLSSSLQNMMAHQTRSILACAVKFGKTQIDR